MEKGDYPKVEREMGKLGYYIADVAHAKPTGAGGNSAGLILGCKRHCQMKGVDPVVLQALGVVSALPRRFVCGLLRLQGVTLLLICVFATVRKPPEV